MTKDGGPWLSGKHFRFNNDSYTPPLKYKEANTIYQREQVTFISHFTPLQEALFALGAWRAWGSGLSNEDSNDSFTNQIDVRGKNQKSQVTLEL